MPLQPVTRHSVADAAFEQLLGGVLTGELDAGEELPGERALTEALGVNRQAVREALQRLAAAGVVQIRHGGRTRVSDFRREGGLDLLPRLLFNGGQIDPEVARSILELRSCLGPEAAARCAQRAEDPTRVAITDLVARMESAGSDLELLTELDLRLWDVIVDGADNIAYRLAHNGLRRTYEPIAALLAETLGPELLDHDGRRALAAAIAAADPAAAAAATRSLLARGEQAVAALLATMTGDRTAS